MILSGGGKWSILLVLAIMVIASSRYVTAGKEKIPRVISSAFSEPIPFAVMADTSGC